MITDITKLKKGDRVYYQPKHYARDRWENGIIKGIPGSAADPGCTWSYNCVWVVFYCDGDWGNYEDYTAALTNTKDLHIGWRWRVKF